MLLEQLMANILMYKLLQIRVPHILIIKNFLALLSLLLLMQMQNSSLSIWVLLEASQMVEFARVVIWE